MKDRSPKKAPVAKRAAKAPAPVSPVYQLKLTLDAVKPAIWRRVSVPGDASLEFLHEVIQVAMGWTNSHMHQFAADGRCFSDLSSGFADELDVLDEAKTSLQEIAPSEKDVFHYEYDFGDGWGHTILVEKIAPPEYRAEAMAQCLAGKRACPPDDCGGPWGYQNLLKILGNPKHAEHESTMEWLGGSFDPEAFDPAAINVHLRTFK